MINRKIVVRTKYQLSKNNPDGKYKKNKIENIDKYTDKMLDYYSNIDKKALPEIENRITDIMRETKKVCNNQEHKCE